jgi:4-amino-4-deoxy-L-arabinose transferase-like glycosyltransferase
LNDKKIAVAVFYAALFVIAVAQIWSRPVDRDEGFWLYTSWRFAEGELPYRDFALPHLPLASVYYAAAVKIFGVSLYALRGLNVALFAASAAFLGAAAARRFGEKASFFAVLLFASSSLTLTWLAPVKTYAPAAAPLTAAVAVWLWPRVSEKPALARALVIGILLGLATLARLTLLVTLAAAAFGIWVSAPARPGRRAAAVAALCAGFLVVTPVIIYFRAAAGDAFAFNAWEIHKLFLGEGATGRWAALLGLLWPPDAAILIILALLALRTPSRRALSFPLAAGVLLILANLVPGSSQRQYFVLAVPPFAAAAGVGATWLWERRKGIAWGVLTVAAVAGGARPVAKVAFDRAHKELVGPAEVYAAARVFADATREGDVVFTGWPGYAALARRVVVPGWELGYFTHRVGERLSAAERRKYHLMTYRETADALAAGRAAFALDGLDTPKEIEPTLREDFVEVTRRHGVTLWRYRGRR